MAVKLLILDLTGIEVNSTQRRSEEICCDAFAGTQALKHAHAYRFSVNYFEIVMGVGFTNTFWI